MSTKSISLPRKTEQKVGIVADNGNTGYVKCKGSGTWVLADNLNPYRMRWGNAEEIKRDVSHFIAYGVLPKPSSERW